MVELYVTFRKVDRSGGPTLLALLAEPSCQWSFGQRTLKLDAFFIEVDRVNQYGVKIETRQPQYLAYRRRDRLA
ncbi:hypothetical protein [Embleya sp. NPDC050493]|uniref:hypothetical protein n=1 Tax=Embleya sp. NPDC050493 TaxID=3363989 RepID=UPI003790D264